MSSSNKADSNRRNAQFSTGPRTEAGKDASRMNSVTHGLRSNCHIVPGETEEEFETFRRAIMQDLAPWGPQETELAETIVRLHWRKRRIPIYEAAEINRQAQEAMRNASRTLKEEREVEAADKGLFLARTCENVQSQLEGNQEQMKKWESDSEKLNRIARKALKTKIAGTEACDLLNCAYDLLISTDLCNPRVDILGDGDGDSGLLGDSGDRLHYAASDPDKPEFLKAIGIPVAFRSSPATWTGWTAKFFRKAFAKMAELMNHKARDIYTFLEQDVKYYLDDLSKKGEELRLELETLEREEEDRTAVACRVSLMPPPSVLENVIRYEAHINKQLSQAMNQLERLQARRLNQPLVPPVVGDFLLHT